MNLGQLRDRVANELRYNPNSAAYKADVSQVLNQVYQDLCSAHRWPFLEHTTTLHTYATETNTITSVNASPYCRMTVSSAPTLNINRAYATVIDADDNEFQACSTDGVDDIYLDMRGYGPTPVVGACTVRFDRYPLPRDCMEVLGLVSRTDGRGEVFLEDRSAERELLLNNTDTPSAPFAYLMDNGKELRGPRATLVAGGNTSLGSLAAGTYQYFYVYANFYSDAQPTLISPPSNIVEATISSTGRVLFTVVDARETSVTVGLNQHWYRANNDGIFRFWTTSDASSTTMTDLGTTTPSQDIVWDDAWVPQRTIRLYPRPDTATDYELRYLRRPRRMQHDNDVPALPVEFHEIVVHLAVAYLAARSEGEKLAKFHEKLAEEKLSRMTKRYLDDGAQSRVRAGWSSGRRKVVPVPSIRYTP